MKRKIIILTIYFSVLLAFSGCMSASHLGHGGGDSHASHQSGGGSHSGGCH
ncbi:MAG: hypothetical protein GZ094_20405 [Mariniphaga sp.]|nr:hypothetical protein [Mariniphaga sp.]